MYRSKRIILYVILIGIIAVAGFSCDDNETRDSSQKFTFMLPGEGSSLDPNMTNEIYSTAVLQHLYEGLVTVDQNGQLKNASAETIEVSHGNTYFVFKLRDDLVWSDGQAITARDFRHAFLRILDPKEKSINASVISPYILNAKEYINGEVDQEAVGVAVEDDLTLTIRTVAPTPFLLDILTHSAFVPTRLEGEQDPAWLTSSKVITNGAFLIEEYIPASHVTLVKNPKYRDQANISLDVLKFIFRQDEDNAAELYNTGEIQGLFEISATELRKIPNSELETSSMVLPSTSFLTYNHNDDLIGNVKFRELVSIAIDRHEIVNKELLGAGVPSKYLVPYSYVVGNEKFRDFTELDEGVDLERARQLLEELKKEGLYKNQVITFHYMLTGPNGKVSESLVGMLKNLGLEVQAVGVPWSDLYNIALNEDYDILMMGWSADYPHPMTFLNVFETGAFYAPVTRWYDSEYEKMLVDYMAITNSSEGLKMLRAIEDKILKGYHITPIYHRKRISIISNTLKGWHHGSAYYNFTYSYIE